MAIDIGVFQVGGVDIGVFQNDSSAQSVEVGTLQLLSFADPTVTQPFTIEVDTLGPLLDLDDPEVDQPDTIRVGTLGPLVSLGAPTATQPETIQLTGLGPLFSPAAPSLLPAGSTIQLSGLGPLLSLPNPYINNTQSLKMGALGPLMTLGGPTLISTPRRIILNELGPLLKLGAPTISGGVDTLQVFVGKYDRTPYVVWRSTGLHCQTIGRWSGEIAFMSTPGGQQALIGTDQEWEPQFGQAITIKEHGHTLLDGAIVDVTRELINGTETVRYRCQAADYAYLTNYTVVPRRTYQKSAYSNYSSMVQDIWRDYLKPHGIGNGGIPADMGSVDTDLVVNFWYVGQVLDEISKLTGFQWYVDSESKDLVFVSPDDAAAAPFDITDDSENWIDLTINSSLTDYRNKQYVVSNRPILPQGSSTGLDGEECYTLSGGRQAAANDHGLPDNFIWLNFPAAQVTRIKVNGTAKTLYDELSPEWAAFVEANILTPAMATVWTWTPGRQWVRPYVALGSSDTVCVKYVPTGQNAVVDATDPLEITPPDDPPDGELFSVVGNGVIENVLQVNDITTQEDLDAFAAAVLQSSGVIPYRVSYRTKFPGLKVGMVQTVDVAKLAESFEFFITGLDGQCEGPDLGEGSSFIWTVSGFNIPDPANWKTYWLRMIRRSNHPTPVLATNVIAFALINGGAGIAEGEGITNPAPADVNGQISEAIAVFSNPPQGQSLTLDVKINGVSIFKPDNMLVIGPGDSSLVKVTDFAQAALYIRKDDVVTLDASYEDAGGVRVDADYGTVKLRILNG